LNQDWNSLLAFESKDLVSKFLSKKFNKKASAGKVGEITASFIQARAYFNSSTHADITVKPLLQYYGVLAISRALILTLEFEKREVQLQSSHGLKSKNWPEKLKTFDFQDLEIELQNGTLFELLDVTENKSYLRGGVSSVNYKTFLNKPSKGTIIKLSELIQCFPDLKEEYALWTNDDLIFAIIQELKYDETSNLVTIKLPKGTKKEVMDTVFPEEDCKNKIFDNGVLTYYSGGWHPNITQSWLGPVNNGTCNIGNLCVMPCLKDDIGLNLISGLYMISYTFGMLARYHPSVWMNILRGGQGDKIYPFAHRIMQFIDNYYPKVVLDFLKGPYPFENKKTSTKES
jgi:hypothetical protein